MSSYVLSAISLRNIGEARLLPSRVARLGQRLADALKAAESRRAACELMALSDRQLLDIGIRRNEIAGIEMGAKR